MAPLQLSVVLGHVQWLNLLARPLFSILDHVYVFCRVEPTGQQQAIPAELKQEIAMVVALCQQWSFFLDKPWAKELLATDASQEFGFGLARRRCSEAQSRELGRLSEKRGNYVALSPQMDAPTKRRRLGRPHHLYLK